MASRQPSSGWPTPHRSKAHACRIGARVSIRRALGDNDIRESGSKAGVSRRSYSKGAAAL